MAEPQISHDPADAQLDAEEEHDKYLRAIARLDNFRKRHRGELAKSSKAAETRVLLELLPIVDDVERAFRAALEAKGRGALGQVREGMRLVLSQIRVCLGRLEVEGFESKGKEFVRDLMHALTEVPTNELAPGTVVEELYRGYTRGGELLRPAKVAVAVEPKEEGGDD